MALVLASSGCRQAGGRLLICSGWIPEGPDVEPDLAESGVSAALVQLARDDDVVPAELTRWSAEALGSTGCAIDLLEYPGGHGLYPADVWGRRTVVVGGVRLSRSVPTRRRRGRPR